MFFSLIRDASRLIFHVFFTLINVLHILIQVCVCVCVCVLAVWVYGVLIEFFLILRVILQLKVIDFRNSKLV